MLVPQPLSGALVTRIPSIPHVAIGLRLTQTCSLGYTMKKPFTSRMELRLVELWYALNTIKIILF